MAVRKRELGEDGVSRLTLDVKTAPKVGPRVDLTLSSIDVLRPADVLISVQGTQRPM